MSFNSCKNLGSDMILGNVVAKTITCDSITILDANDENLTVETITATNGNFDVINANTGIIGDITLETLTSQTTDSSIITATDKFLVSNNAMILNNTNTSSTTQLLGNNSATVGEYLSTVYPESIGTNISYAVEQLAAGDNGSQSLIFTAGGAYDDDVENTIQSYDSYRKTAQNLCLNPLGGDVIIGDTLTAINGNFDVINVATLNVSNPDDPTIPTDLNVSSITATTGNIENLTTDAITSSSITVTSSLGCNSLNSQNTTSDDITANEILTVAGTFEALKASSESTTPLLGLDAITTGDYLQQVSSGDDSHFSLVQLASGDSNSQSIILSAGGSFATSENSIQSFDSKLDNGLTLNLNPLGGKVVTDNLTYTNGDKPIQTKPLTSSAMPNMEVLFFHLTGTVEQSTATMLLANNISGTSNYAVFPSIYYGYGGSSDTYHVYDSYFNINVSDFTDTQFYCNIKKGTGDAANVYIQFLVIYDVPGTDFPKNY